MRDQNNLGRQYTEAPRFGKTYPNTQYKGYAEEENKPYGGANASINNTIHHSHPSTLYGYTSQYQGNIPYHTEGRFNNVQAHGGSHQYQASLSSHQQASVGMSPLQSYTENANQSKNEYHGLSQYQSGTSHSQNLSQYQSGAGNSLANQYPPTAGVQYQTQQQTHQGEFNYASNNQSFLEKSGQIKSPKYNDYDRINDLLASEKYLTEGYNISTFEATNPQLQKTLQSILNDTHQNREVLYQTMNQRGWYQTEQASQQQISEAYNKFNQYKNQLPY